VEIVALFLEVAVPHHRTEVRHLKFQKCLVFRGLLDRGHQDTLEHYEQFIFYQVLLLLKHGEADGDSKLCLRQKIN